MSGFAKWMASACCWSSSPQPRLVIFINFVSLSLFPSAGLSRLGLLPRGGPTAKILIRSLSLPVPTSSTLIRLIQLFFSRWPQRNVYNMGCGFLDSIVSAALNRSRHDVDVSLLCRARLEDDPLYRKPLFGFSLLFLLLLPPTPFDIVCSDWNVIQSVTWHLLAGPLSPDVAARARHQEIPRNGNDAGTHRTSAFFLFLSLFGPSVRPKRKTSLFWRRSAIGSVTSIDRVFSFPSTSHPPLFRHPMTISIEFRTQLLLRRRRQLRGSQTGYFLSTLSFNAAQHRSSCVIIHHPRRRVTVLLRSLNISYHWLRPFPFLYTAGPLPVAELWE